MASVCGLIGDGNLFMVDSYIKKEVAASSLPLMRPLGVLMAHGYAQTTAGQRRDGTRGTHA
jgi:hypothetical protein